MLVEPSELDEVISVTDAIRPNCRSRGVATAAAMVSGLAPGSEAETPIVGKSTCGTGDTGSRLNATAPASPSATASSVVATGRRMNGAEMFMSARLRPWRGDGTSRRDDRTTDRSPGSYTASAVG